MTARDAGGCGDRVNLFCLVFFGSIASVPCVWSNANMVWTQLGEPHTPWLLSWISLIDAYFFFFQDNVLAVHSFRMCSSSLFVVLRWECTLRITQLETVVIRTLDAQVIG